MPFTDDLHDAGARAAQQPVPPPPTIDSLTEEVGRRRTRRRAIVGSSIAGLALVAAIPLAASQIGGDDRPSLVTAAQEGDGPSVGDEAPAESTQPEPEGAADGEGTTSDTEDAHNGLFGLFGNDENHEFSLEFEDKSFTVNAVGGDAAADKAADSAAAADDTRDIEGVDVWIRAEGDRTIVSALIEPTLFVEVAGPSDAIDELLEMLTTTDGMFRIEPFEPGSIEGLPPEVREMLDREIERLEELRKRMDEQGFPFEPGSPNPDAFEDMLPPEVLERLREDGFGFFFGEDRLGELFDHLFEEPEIEEAVGA